ncbi:MAG: TM0106 family RecB-like putative nuclease [Pseudomonadota bacterium]|nr:TM0106 family RecB-like putative nuclease [Pseudomonadota bacterium]MDP1904499.1 TM0106 family RecB-like putative nuclease [Pseudomonadota bacterium]MDP2352021.1 TM0106 family RecB-like putative nuclease [Pseudomonadota bacterium]
MQRTGGKLTASASDLVGFLACPHKTTLDLVNLDTPLERAAPDEQVELIQDKGFAHESAYLETLREGGGRLVELSSAGSFAENVAATRAAMAAGVDIIFQAALSHGAFMGYADFLRRVERPSALGAWSYEVADTKLAHQAKPKFMIQLAHYSELLASDQGIYPERMHLVFGNHTERSFRVGDYRHYYRRLRQRFDAFLDKLPATAPEKCDACDYCDWRERCAAEWEAQDHLNRVANISKMQIKRLRQQGVHTLAQLGSLASNATVTGMRPETLAKLRAQAGLQYKKRETGENQLELLPRDASARTGFDRLPPPDDGDLFFDMEGDPLHEGGLEYLFGVHVREKGAWVFHDFWAHDRRQEKAAFAQFVDFATQRLREHPHAHIHHYAHYEPTALKRLMSLHGIREAEIDQLLRDGKFVDLYQIVREAIRISEPRYSIKNLETFYMAKRDGEVTNAGSSIVYYEKWRQTRDDDLLRKIRDYNEDDCRSTYLLHDWLLGLKPQATTWADRVAAPDNKSVKSDKIREHEARLAAYEERLLLGVPEDSATRDGEQKLRALMAHLLDFHRRAAKPAWWALFARHDMDEEELADDAECIAGLRLVSVTQVGQGKSAGVATYSYPEQEFKLRQGDACLRTDTTQNFGKLGAIDEDQRLLEIRLSKKKGEDLEIPTAISISAGGPIDTTPIKEALFRLADGLLEDKGRFAAALDFLRKAPPRIRGHEPGQPIIDESREALPQIVEAVVNLDHSTLFIQGPPGAGKTYTGSHLIAELIARGYRVGITSNSHKAIHNLLAGVEKRADERGQNFAGIYKASSVAPDSEFKSRRIASVRSNDLVFLNMGNPHVQLFAGTAWLFSAAAFADQLDYLFVDEAGQVATANLVAMATSARNIVLLGDQMQLGQPIQGIHPGESGLSALDFLLEGRATIPPDQGVFLATTWRMHPDVCRFISDAVYEGRLYPEPKNAEQRLILKPDAHPLLRPTGLVFVPAIHDACAQRSEEEARIVLALYQSLLAQSYRDRDGREHPMTPENILVVAPYNMQVNLLRRTLPEDARVGTVDKFQGQEAEAVIVSMTTSNGDTLPRYIEFLYSKNRLNVALSRARCLALLVASPALADIPCATVEQMGLVNLMCRVMKVEAT